MKNGRVTPKVTRTSRQENTHFIGNYYVAGGTMKRGNLDRDVKTLSELRANAANLVRLVHETRRPLVITHHGRSAAILLDVEVYEALMNRFETLLEIRLAGNQIAEGMGIPHSAPRKKVIQALG